MSTYSTHAYSDIQGDMARHDEEGSGGSRDDFDDEEYIGGAQSGDGPGSGDGKINKIHFCLKIFLQLLLFFFFFAGPTSSSIPREHGNNNESAVPAAGAASQIRISYAMSLITILSAFYLVLSK